MFDSPLPLKDYCLSCIREAVVEVKDNIEAGLSRQSIDSLPAPSSSGEPCDAIERDARHPLLVESRRDRHATGSQPSSLNYRRGHEEDGIHPVRHYHPHATSPSLSTAPSSPPSSSSKGCPPPTSRSSSSGSIYDEMMRSMSSRSNELSVDPLLSPSSSSSMSSSVTRCLNRSNIFYSSSHLISSIGEVLLTCLSEEGRLTDNLMSGIFHPDNCRLDNVRIPDASSLTRRGLRVLRGHKIRRLEVIGLTKATINELIGCLGEYTLNNVSFLSVSRSYFTSSARFCVVVGLAKLRNLKHLDVSHTDINHHGLEIIVEDLPNLQSLNISATKVKDLNPLKKCKSRLKSLSMYNLRCSSSFASQNNNNQVDPFMAVLLELNQLVKLDISDDRDSPVDVLTRGSTSVGPLLKRPDLFTHLKYLDISGKDGIELEDLKKFLAFKTALGHDSALEFLGLMQTDICTNEDFLNEPQVSDKEEDSMEVDDEEWKDSPADQAPALRVTGFATQTQILNSLKVYVDRPSYIQKSLCFLYNYTINELPTPRVDLIDIILPVMKKHSKMIGIQMAATACLYNLTKGKIADKIHPKWLAKVVNATLDAMESFPNHQQLQKNTLLTLCSDRILQEVTFNRFRCTKLVMESLVNFKDLSMNRMAVAICSILAAKISTDETSSLGAKPVYMETLLQVVRSRVQQGCQGEQQHQQPLELQLNDEDQQEQQIIEVVEDDEEVQQNEQPPEMDENQMEGDEDDVVVMQGNPPAAQVEVEPDIMLKFTLSALWNLTDESPSTCSMFLEKGGISLYLDVLDKYRGLPSVEMKVLGLLNNIAEVPSLRSGLLTTQFISCLRKLLASPSIDVSYFAAGIFAHLMSDFDSWTDFCCRSQQESKLFRRDDIANQLSSVVLSWKTPENEMVAYRSFNPFLSLLRCDYFPEVQLWAVWAIHHVCSKNPGRYCEMLLQGETLTLFKRVMETSQERNQLPLIDYCRQTIQVLRSSFPHASRELEWYLLQDPSLT